MEGRAAPSIDWNWGDSDGMTPLHLALWKGNKDAVKEILDIPGINYEVRTHDGDTLAHAAVKSGDHEIVALLCDVMSLSIDWNVGDSDGMTPLFWALKLGCKGVVKRILDIPGINYHVKTHFGATLALAAVSSGDDEIMALLSSKL